MLPDYFLHTELHYKRPNVLIESWVFRDGGVGGYPIHVSDVPQQLSMLFGDNVHVSSIKTSEGW